MHFQHKLTLYYTIYVDGEWSLLFMGACIKAMLTHCMGTNNIVQQTPMCNVGIIPWWPLYYTHKPHTNMVLILSYNKASSQIMLSLHWKASAFPTEDLP